MSWRHRPQHRKDANQEEMVAALQKYGFQVWDIGRPVDLLLAKGPLWITAEIKNKDGRNKESEGQRDFARNCARDGRPHFVLREVEDIALMLEMLVDPG